MTFAARTAGLPYRSHDGLSVGSLFFVEKREGRSDSV